VAVIWGKILGAHTIWIDSVANAEALSRSGRVARILANECLTQWPHLAKKTGVRYEGSVL